MCVCVLKMCVKREMRNKDFLPSTGPFPLILALKIKLLDNSTTISLVIIMAPQHSDQEHCEGESISSAAVKSKVNADRKDQEVSDGSQLKEIWSTITFCTKEQNLGSTAGATAVLRHPTILLPGALVSLGLLVSPLASGLPGFFVFCLWCCSESEDSVNNSRIQHSNCLWFRAFLSLCT